MTRPSLISFRPLKNDYEAVGGRNDISPTQTFTTVKRASRKGDDVRYTGEKKKGKQKGA